MQDSAATAFDLPLPAGQRGEEVTQTLSYTRYLASDMLVAADGKTGTQENASAGESEVVPEGEGGFDIHPDTGGGPLLVPLLP